MRSSILRLRLPLRVPLRPAGVKVLPLRRFLSTTTTAPAETTPATEKAEKPYYITTPIFYVNAAPHVGHLYTMVLADVLKRWQELHGRRAILVTGTDEHGMKVQQAAAAAGTTPRLFCDAGADQFKALATVANCSFDIFQRTSTTAHADAVQHFWRQLDARGYIYKGAHSGWYCVSDETFYPSTQIETIVDPASGRKLTVSKETGKTVEWTSETNYHFRLSELQPKLKQWYEDNPEWVVPAVRHRDLAADIDAGLGDLSISRPQERLSWGVPVPDDPTQTIYVWLDALVNYLTASHYPFTPGHESTHGWPADVHLLGKDITKFHGIYWPSFLLALGLPLPTKLVTHSHWTLDNAKMSKSSGNGVNPFYALERFGVDTLRYYLCRHGRLAGDTRWSNEWVLRRYNNELRAGFGNLVNRVCSKVFSIRAGVEAAMAQEQGEGWALDVHDLKQKKAVETARDSADEKMRAHDVSGALSGIKNLMQNTNQYMQSTAPWSLHTPDTAALQARRIYFASEGIRVAALLLQPFIPQKAGEMLDLLAVDEGKRGIEFATLGADRTYGAGTKGRGGRVFPELSE
ncbi:methionyl-tRNA synthetase [Geopyxis carbonaria]|nr:methionyl-tRNA synthetase [Geopyxis carbonaria]